MDEELTHFMLDLMVNAGIKNDELEKHLILFQTYYREIKTSLDASDVDLETRKIMMAKFSQFVMEFEIICIKAYKPSTESKSTARNIINMYLKKFEGQ